MADVVVYGQVLLVLLALAVLLPVVGLLGRRLWLSLGGRVFECSARLTIPARGSGWMLGTARYVGDRFEWFRTFSLSFRPRVVLLRSRLAVTAVRAPDDVEARDLLSGQLIAELAPPHAGTSLAMDRDHLTAFHSWTEAGAPGDQWRE